MLEPIPGSNHLMIDLHGSSVKETKQLLQKHFAKIETDNITEIYIITGRGNHVNPDGSRGVLKRLLPKLLKPYDPDIIQVNKEIGAYKIILRSRLALKDVKNVFQDLRLNENEETQFIQYFQKQADQNDKGALFVLGAAYLYGGFEKFHNPQHGLNLLEQAEKLGSIDAAIQLGTAYLEGLVVPQNHKKAFAFFKKAALTGHAYAQHCLAKCYLLGQGTKQSDAEGVVWLEKSAQQGIAQSQFNLGKSYLDGKFTPQDIKLGLHYLNQAAEQGMDEAEVMLARLYATGDQVEQSNSKAFDFYLRAAFSNNTFALYMVGTYLLDGRCGFPATDAIAFEWFLRAAERGDADGQAKVGYAYLQGIGIEKNSEKARDWIQKGLAQKNKFAYYSMSQFYKQELPEHNEIKAFEYLELSAEAGYSTAQFELALCLLKGNTYVKQDFEKGMHYLSLAKEQNHAESIDLYQKLQELSLYEQDITLEASTSADKIKPEEEKTTKTRASAYTNQAKTLYKNRNYAQAISFFQKALKLNLPKEQPELICNIGHSYFALKDFSQAINFYSKAINMLPEQTSLYNWRAKCYRKLALQSKYTNAEKQLFIEKAENDEQKTKAEEHNPSYQLK